MKKIKNRLENHFKMSFTEIVHTHFKMGMSRYECTHILNQLLGIENESSPEAIKSSTIWNMVKYLIDHKHLTDFYFAGRKKGNPRYCVPKPKNKIIKKNISITLTCLKHSPHKIRVFHHEGEMGDFGVVCLRAIRCPECDSFGSGFAEFEYNGNKYKKAVLNIDNIQTECFVDENMNEIDNPFEVKEEVKI